MQVKPAIGKTVHHQLQKVVTLKQEVCENLKTKQHQKHQSILTFKTLFNPILAQDASLREQVSLPLRSEYQPIRLANELAS